jgi:hypothetical protein
MGKIVLSLFLVYFPAGVVAVWIGRRLPRNARKFLVTMGPACVVCGITTYLGVKLFDIPVIARTGHVQGDGAVAFAYLEFIGGAFMTGLHFVLVRLFPKWMAGEKPRKKANQSTDPTLASGTPGAGHQPRHP